MENDKQEKKMGAAIRLLNTEEFTTIRCLDLSLIAFGIPWSSPCQNQHKILVSLTKNCTGIMTIARVDVESHPEIAEKINIQTVPTILVYQKNREIKRMVGLQSFTVLQTLLSDLQGNAINARSVPGPDRGAPPGNRIVT
jgi:thioredoxin 1